MKIATLLGLTNLTQSLFSVLISGGGKLPV